MLHGVNVLITRHVLLNSIGAIWQCHAVYGNAQIQDSLSS
jgi:hypothetical protein